MNDEEISNLRTHVDEEIAPASKATTAALDLRFGSGNYGDGDVYAESATIDGSEAAR